MPLSQKIDTMNVIDIATQSFSTVKFLAMINLHRCNNIIYIYSSHYEDNYCAKDGYQSIARRGHDNWKETNITYTHLQQEHSASLSITSQSIVTPMSTLYS